MLFAPLLLGALLFAAPLAAREASTEVLETGKSLYREKCRDCHGSRAQQRALGKSKVLNRLKTDEIIAKLREVRDAGNAETPADIAKSDLGEDDIQSLGIYIQSLKRR